jgi:hypothetical protein
MRMAARTFVTLLAVGMTLLGPSLHLCACDGSAASDECCSDGRCGGPDHADDHHHALADDHHHALADDHHHALADDHHVHPIALADEACGGGHARSAEAPSPDPSMTAPCSCPTLELPNSAAETISPGPRLVGHDASLLVGQDVVCTTAWEHQPARIARRSSFRPPGPLPRHLELGVLRC